MPIGNPTAQTEASKRYQKKVGLIAKSYKLKKDLAEEFARVCKEEGVSQAALLTEWMTKYIDEQKQNKQ